MRSSSGNSLFISLSKLLILKAICTIIIKVRGDEISFTNFVHVCRLAVLKYMYNDNSALMYSSSDLYVQTEDGLTGRSRNM